MSANQTAWYLCRVCSTRCARVRSTLVYDIVSSRFRFVYFSAISRLRCADIAVRFTISREIRNTDCRHVYVLPRLNRLNESFTLTVARLKNASNFSKSMRRSLFE